MKTTSPPRRFPRPCRSPSLFAAWFVSLAVMALGGPAVTMAQDARPKDKKTEKSEQGDKGAKKTPTKFEIQAIAIQATKKNADVDKDLKPLAKTLADTISGFTGFKALTKINGSAEKGEAFSADLPSGFKIKVTPEDRTGETIKLRVKITPPAEKGKEKDKSDDKDRGSLYEIKSGTSQLISYKHPDDKDDKYVIAVSAK